MLKFTFKNMAIKKVQIILIVLSIVISAGIGVLAYNVANQVGDGITNNAGYYSLIIGPAGSKTQLAMNSMYFTDKPLGTIPYSVFNEIKNDTARVKKAIPFAMADNYNGSGVVGTNSEFLESKNIAQGEMFKDDATMQVVVGAKVAKENNLKIGDEIHTSHTANGSHVHKEGLKVVGILENSFSSYDNMVFTQIKTLWDMHSHGHADEGHADENDGQEHEEENHNHMHEAVCSILVNVKGLGAVQQLLNEYDGKIIKDAEDNSYTLQAIEPMEAVRDVLNDADNTKYIVFVLCAVILIMNIMVISIITLLNMYNSAKEISLMRLIGISMKKINLLYIIQNSIIGLVSILLAFGMSRICLFFMNDYVSSMGVVLNISKVYAPEWLILAGVFVISVLPTVIWTFAMSRKDSISE